MRKVAVAVLSVALATALVACGNEDDDPLAQTEQNMRKLKSATIELRLAAAAGAGADKTGPVGFELSGPFAFSADQELAVFDLTYTRLRGDATRVTRARSTGRTAFVTVDGETFRVPRKDAAALRVTDDAGNGFGDLGISGWVNNAVVKAGPRTDGRATDVVTGDVDVADMFSDLARVASSVGGDTELAALDEDAAERLQKLVKKSSIRVVTTRATRQLRSLRAVVDFGTRSPERLREILGRYADAQIEVTLELDEAPAGLQVDEPDEYATP